MSQTMQDLIDLQSSDAALITNDQATIASDNAKLTQDTAQLGTDQATQVTDASSFQASLVMTGPVGSVVNGSVYLFAAPGTVIMPNTPYPLASSVPAPDLTPAPTGN
jgi:hypothetical protein